MLARSGMVVAPEAQEAVHTVVAHVDLLADWTMFEELTIVLFLPVVPAVAESWRGICHIHYNSKTPFVKRTSNWNTVET